MMTPEQLTLDFAGEIAADEEIVTVEELFEPDGRQRCPRCRKRLLPFGGRLYCVNAYCPGGA